MKKGSLLIFVSSFITGVVVIFTAEVYLRYIKEPEVNEIFNCNQLSMQFRYAYQPNTSCRYKRYGEYDVTTRINNFGLRSDSNVIIDKPIGIRRILFLGDSFVAGHEVLEKDTFVRLIENQWREAGYPVEVLNGGIRGYSPILDLFYLKFNALKLNPDKVVLVINSGDFGEDRRLQEDVRYNFKTGAIEGIFTDWHYFYYRRQATQSANLQTSGPRTTPWRQILLPHKVIELLKTQLSRLVKKSSIHLGDWRDDPLVLERAQVEPDTKQTLLQQTQDNIREINALLKNQGVKFYLVLLPMGFEAGKNEWRYGRAGWALEQNTLYEPTALLRLAQWAKEEGISVINLLPYLRNNPDKLKFLPYDGHLNIFGHQVVADALSQELLKSSFDDSFEN